MSCIPTLSKSGEAGGDGDRNGSAPACRSILIADGDPEFVAQAQHALGASLARVVVASDGAQALQHLQSNACDLAIVDLSNPQIDGFRLIAHIRHTPGNRELPIIATADEGDDEAEEEADGLDVELFRTKPLDWDSVVACIDAMLCVAGDEAAKTGDEAAQIEDREPLEMHADVLRHGSATIGTQPGVLHAPKWSKNWAKLLRRALPKR